MRFKNILTAIDSHTEGQPTRMVVSGYPRIPGKTMEEKADYAREHLDHLRTAILHEPRGAISSFGCVMTPPVSDEAAFGIIWMVVGVDKRTRYIHMCGHGTIGVATTAVEMGLVEAKEPVTEVAIDTPVGLVRAKVNVSGGKAKSVTIRNVPVFMYEAAKVNIPGIGEIKADIVFGGCNYPIVEAKDLGIEPTPAGLRKAQVELIPKVLKAMNEQVKAQHPELDFIRGFNQLLLSHTPSSSEATVKNICIDPWVIDRSPCGTGTTARMAQAFGKGELEIGKTYITESAIGSLFYGKLVEEVKVGSYRGAIPEVTGRAFITGINQYVLDEDDPFKYGFML